MRKFFKGWPPPFGEEGKSEYRIPVRPKSSEAGKVMFSQACVILSTIEGWWPGRGGWSC